MCGCRKQGGKAHAKAKSHSSWASLQFSWTDCITCCANTTTTEGGAGTPVYKVAALQYLTTEILELANNATQLETHIIPPHLQLATHNDELLNKLLGKVTIAQGGVLPNIQAILLAKKT